MTEQEIYDTGPPPKAREYIHQLESNADPAGMVRENMQLWDTNKGLQVMNRLSTLPQHKMTRAYVRSVPCPDCGANANDKCVGARGKPRTSSHAARWGAYRESADSSKSKGN